MIVFLVWEWHSKRRGLERSSPTFDIPDQPRPRISLSLRSTWRRESSGVKDAARDVISSSPHAGAWRMLRGEARSAWPSRATRTARSSRPARSARRTRPAWSSRCNASNKTEEIVVSEFTSATSSFQVNEVSLPEPELWLRSGAALQRAHRRRSDDVARCGPPSLRGYGGTFSGFQLRCASQAVFGGATPSGHALGSACLLGPVATARCFSEIKFCNGHIDRRIGWASTPGGTPKELFEAWRPLLANYRKPAPAFVKERLKFRASAPGA